MSAFSDYFETIILNYLRGTALPAPPAKFYIGLYSTPTDESNIGGTELNGNGYARLGVNAATTSWTAPAAGGVISNAIELAFPVATGNWANATHFAIHAAATGGNRYYHGPLTTPRQASLGDVIRFPIGTFTITVA